ncbi:MAG: redox-regulated ATPase YchF [Candidatus Niyogibacteria bacterium]|nr:redox-regulated ATPase YchF [Candidatus Niyogibacteria bacterium]
MSTKIGIVGLPNVGKSTLFKALTKKQVNIANYPFVTVEPNVGVVEVPDERIDWLAKTFESAKKIYAAVEFVDIAGLIKGAASGEGLGNAFLSHIKEVDAIAEVVRIFPAGKGEEITHVMGGIDPARDIEVIDIELSLKDLQTAVSRAESLAKKTKTGDKKNIAQKDFLDKIIAGLEKGGRASEILKETELAARSPEEEILLKETPLLTAKKRIFVFNASEEQIASGWKPDAVLEKTMHGDPWLLVSAKIEDELNSLAEEDRKEYLKSLGMESSGLDRLISLAYKTLGLITFLTSGEDETRAWTIPAGSLAPRAGRAIHSDFEEKFIRAEVIGFEELKKCGSMADARKTGLVRTEGKGYEVKDGDVIEFKI